MKSRKRGHDLLEPKRADSAIQAMPMTRETGHRGTGLVRFRRGDYSKAHGLSVLGVK